MTEKTIVPFDCIGFCLRLDMFFFRHKGFIRLPMVCTYLALHFIFDLLPKLFSCLGSPSANFAIDESFPMSINSNPDPTVVFFEPTYVCISSNSTTSIWSELRRLSKFSPKDLIQLNTETWLTARTLPIERNPNPSRYKIKAFRFRSSGFPRCSTVKRYLQSLHKYLCFCLLIGA